MFCPKCGERVDEGIKFCAVCGQRQEDAQLPDSPAPPMAKLAVVRPDQFFLVNPAVRITVDDGPVYKVENGSSVVIPLALGRHVLSFAASIRNKVVEVWMTGDKTLEVKWNRITGSLEVKEKE